MPKSSDVYTLNSNGVEVSFMADGGRIISINVPDAKGETEDVVIGYDTPEAALNGDAYFGALCGRYANRIVNGKFSIDGYNGTVRLAAVLTDPESGRTMEVYID